MKNFYKDLGVDDILLIEDDPWNRDSLSMFFRIVECRTQSVTNAKDAIVAMTANRFNLILCEYQLPEMSGLALMEAAGILQPDAVKIMLTSYPIGKLSEDAARAGIHEVIRKPFSIDEFEKALMRSFPRARASGREPISVR